MQFRSALFSAIAVIGASGIHIDEKNKNEPSPQEVASCFGQLDTNSDEHLNQTELRAVAVHLGFSGSDAEWSNTYKLLVQDQGLADAGMDLDAFKSFLRGTADDNLLVAVKELCPQVLVKQLDASQDSKQEPKMIMEDASQANADVKEAADATANADAKAIEHAKSIADAQPIVDAQELANASKQQPDTVKNSMQANVSKDIGKDSASFNVSQDISHESDALTEHASEGSTHQSFAETISNGLTLESMAARGKYVNIKNNRKRKGARIQVWESNQTLAGSQWHLQKVQGKVSVYTVESVHTNGMYLGVAADESTGEASLQLVDNGTSDFAQWRVQNVAGAVDVYTLQNEMTKQYLLKGADDVQASRAADTGLGDDVPLISAHWMIHALPRPSNAILETKIEGVWRTVEGCWDVSGMKIQSGSCGPTPAPTPKPTRAPTAAPTLTPTVKGHWAVIMACEDAHGNKLAPINCQSIVNGHAVDSQHHKIR
jgi:hypothetical protein